MEFLNVAAGPTTKVMMVLAGATPAVEGFAAFRTDDVDFTALSH
jgi:hypothetical protein